MGLLSRYYANYIERRRAGVYNAERAKVVAATLPTQGVGVELGVHKGFFTDVLTQVAQPTRLHLIDPWYLMGANWTWGRGDRSTVDGLRGIMDRQRDGLASQRVVLHIGDDLEILETFADGYFDWAYIDSTHIYEHTLKELAILQRKVKPTGVIAGDDWQPDPTHRHHGVCKAVREFLADAPYELIYSNDTNFQWAIRRKVTR